MTGRRYLSVRRRKGECCLPIRIYIDQCHNPPGYPNAGASWYGTDESDITYAIGTRLAELLRADPRFAVRVSRPTAATVIGNSNASSLAERVRQANAWPADYFISIHANASLDTSANGTEVYVYRLGTQAEVLAERVLKGIVQRMGTRDRGVRANPSLYVLRRTRMPAILVETAYMSNPADLEKLRDDPYGFAQGIYNGIMRYFGFE